MSGQDGATGPAGPRGVAGVDGRGLTRWQGLSMFLITAFIGILGFAWLESHQDAIDRNSAAIADGQYQRCLSGNRILARFNTQQEQLVRVEEQLRDDPDASPAGKRAAAARIRIYKAAMVIPITKCVRR